MPVPAALMVDVYVVDGFVLYRTRFGRYTYSIDANIIC
jgi:ribose/xylose/arabinose/galactoside ABC-type transport system permease subunit